MRTLSVLVILINSNVVFSSNILFANDIASPSHQIWNHEIVKGLLAKGHNVTMFASSPISDSQPNYHAVDIEGLKEIVLGGLEPDYYPDMTIYKSMWFFYDYMIFTCNYTLHSKGFQTILSYPKDAFDLIIFDISCSRCLLPLMQHFNYPPTVGVSAFLLPLYLSEDFGNLMQPAILPFYFFDFDKELTFSQRIKNYFYLRVDKILRDVYIEKTLADFNREIFGNEMDSLSSLQDRIPLLLCNIIQGYHHAQPLTPNIIPVGGLHINKAKKLPKEYQELMDTAKHGVILFSLGTNIKSSKLSNEKVSAILDALGQLEQLVLWKFEADLEGVPKNVILRKWIPQKEVLAHPNLRLFISHGGGLSTIEASYYGVPVLGIPFFLDQHANMKIMENHKIAVKVDYHTITSEIFLNKINEVLHNPIYSENAKKISQLVNDQPDKPIDRAVFWIEYVIRNNGTRFLDPTSRKLSVIVKYSIDIYLFILFITIVSAYLILKFTCFIKAFFCSKTKEKLKTQ